LRKLATVDELSGVFNLLMMALRRLLNQNRIFIREKTIEERRERYTTAASPIEVFLKDAMAEDSIESDVVTKERLYQGYIRFCNNHKLAILSKENLGKILKKKFQEGRDSSGKRETSWKGIKLKEEYSIDARQKTLDVSTTTAATTTTSTTNNDNGESNIFCYYCSYQTKIIEKYELHVVLKRPKKPAFPGKADMESLGLSPKGNKREGLGA